MADTEIALADDKRRDLAQFHGSRYFEPHTTAPYSTGPSKHHRPFFDDYEIAKRAIEQHLGDLTDLDVFGRNVICAVFCRPNITQTGIYLTQKHVQEDWYQHKVVLVVKLGPDAFTGDESYLRSQYGERTPPQAGDWLFARPEAGIQINLAGEGGSRAQAKDSLGRAMDVFEWDGWPCRIIQDDQFLGRLPKPHGVV